jgi:large subunit ribosomal protein L10
LPSEKILAKKQEQVAGLAQTLQGSVSGVLVDYKGITVASDTKLRRELREAGVRYFVVKNTLLERAADAAGYQGLKDYLTGSSALAVSESDPVAPAKILTKYADASRGKFKVKAGFVDQNVIDADRVSELGRLPGREGLLSMLLSALTGNLRGLACALNTIAEQKAEGAPAEAEPAEAEPAEAESAEAEPAEAESAEAEPAEAESAEAESAEAEPAEAEPAAE